MLTIAGDNRYWGRGATGNRILTEREVARLYERRERWEVDRDRMLDETVSRMPFTFAVNEIGVVVTVIRPVVRPASSYGWQRARVNSMTS